MPFYIHSTALHCTDSIFELFRHPSTHHANYSLNNEFNDSMTRFSQHPPYSPVHRPPSTLMGPNRRQWLVGGCSFSNQNCRRHSISLRSTHEFSYLFFRGDRSAARGLPWELKEGNKKAQMKKQGGQARRESLNDGICRGA